MARNDIAPKGSRLVVLAASCVVVAALWFMQDVLIPVALAILITFLLAPIVNRLERWKLRRVGSVLVVTLALFAAIIGLGYVVTGQVLNLARNLDSYAGNIAEKIGALRPGKGGVIADVTHTFETVQKQLDEPSTGPAAATTQSTNLITQEVASRTQTPRALTQQKLEQGARPTMPTTQQGSPMTKSILDALSTIGGPWTKDNPFPTAVIQPKPSPMEQLGRYVGMVLGPLGTAGLVVVFVIFMLLQREDMRDRLIRLVGYRQLNVTTQALDDAATRISKYLLAQAIVNGTYGMAIAAGLWIIGLIFGGDQGFPNFILWGLLCGVLRFIPYIGPWIGAAFPIALSFAVFHGFGAFAATCGMFIVIELLSNNLMEPWLYGSSTGMSTIAILVSAVFWTFLWGPVGLLLATPLTVCLVVLGKYVPQLAFLDVLLGDEPVLTPVERIFQRLLALDQEEVMDLAQEYLEQMSIERVYDEVLMPALAMAEQDRHRGRLDDRRQAFIRKSMRDLIEELGDTQRLRDEQQEKVEAKAAHAAAADAVVNAARGVDISVRPSGNGKQNGGGGAKKPGGSVDLKPDEPPPRLRLPKDCVINVLVLPAHDEADEIVGLMLAQLLELQGYCTTAVSVTALAGEMVELVTTKQANIVAVSAMPPAAVAHSRYLCKRIHLKYPEIRMIVGLWSFKGDLKKATDRITCVGTVSVMTTLREALDQIHQQAQPLLLRNEATGQPVSSLSAPAGKP